MLEAVNKIRETAASHQRVAVVEVIGRAPMRAYCLNGRLGLWGRGNITAGRGAGYCEEGMRPKATSAASCIVMTAEGVGKGYYIVTAIAAINERTNFNPHITVYYSVGL